MKVAVENIKRVIVVRLSSLLSLRCLSCVQFEQATPATANIVHNEQILAENNRYSMFMV